MVMIFPSDAWNSVLCRWVGLISGGMAGLVATAPAIAQAVDPLGGAWVEVLQGRAELQFREGNFTRPLRSTDWLGSGDRLRTDRGAQVDLNFTEGSWMRLGAQTTLTVIPQSRTVQLQQGTTLLVPNPDATTVIATPNATVSTTAATLVVRYIPEAIHSGMDDVIANPSMTRSPANPSPFTTGRGRTAILVMAAAPDTQATLTLPTWPEIPLTSGQMAIVQETTLYVFEFDTATFLQTSPLMQGIPSNLSTPGSLPSGTEPVQPTPNFAGDYILNPRVISPDAPEAGTTDWFLTP